MIAEKEHAIHGRLKENGTWKRLYPENQSVEVKKKFLWWKWTDWKFPELDRKEAVEKAVSFWESGRYQDVVVLVNNFDEEGWHTYCAVCVWRNGAWDGQSVNTSWAYNY